MDLLQYSTEKAARFDREQVLKVKVKATLTVLDWCIWEKSASCNTFKMLLRRFIQCSMLDNQRIKVQVGLFQRFTKIILTFKHKFLVVLPLT